MITGKPTAIPLAGPANKQGRIAAGNMLPTYCTAPNGSIREIATICVDQTEFLVSKLKDRGTHQAFGVVTNAQDFMHVLRFYTERCRQS